MYRRVNVVRHFLIGLDERTDMELKILAEMKQTHQTMLVRDLIHRAFDEAVIDKLQPEQQPEPAQ